MMNIRYFNTIFFFTILGIVSVGVFFLFRPFFVSIFIAAILAVLFYPIYERLVKIFNGRVKSSAIVMLGIVALTIVLPLTFVSMIVMSEIADVVQKVSSDENTVVFIEDSLELVRGFAPTLIQETTALSQDTFAKVAQKTGNIIVSLLQKTYSGIIGAFIGIFILFFTLFYFFVDGKRIVNRLMFLSPLADCHEKLLFTSFVSMSRAIIKGTLMVGLIQGSLGAFAFFVAGVPSVAIWWVLAVAFGIIPMLGPGIVGFPVGIYYLISGDVTAAIIIISAFVFISIFDNYLRPLFVGRDTQMHTLLVFFATFGGIVSFGLIGFIVGPIMMALFVTLWNIYGIEFKDQLEEYNG